MGGLAHSDGELAARLAQAARDSAEARAVSRLTGGQCGFTGWGLMVGESQAESYSEFGSPGLPRTILRQTVPFDYG
ncbi:MAG TPA: hypothetical protein VL588_01160, partial [Bdellovibrionota bacterium]|nr:hypothetical protein [Bdellovibrionota bacterium]